MLFITNFFINFFLLQITAKLCKREAKVFRLIISSAIGGLYSLIILVDGLPFYLSAFSKLIVAGIMVLCAFSFHRLTSFLIAVFVFLFSSFLVLGIIIGLYYLTNSNMIAINNSTAYFDISARGLLASAFFAYLLSCLVVRLHNKSLSKNEIYTLEITNNDQTIVLCALLDTGNKLREPFSNCPVIVVDKSKVENMVGDSKIRYIPTSTVNGESLMQAFKPNKIVIKSNGITEIIENAYVAMSNDIDSKSFSAVLNPEILSV